MIDLTQDIHPLTDFKHKTPEFTKRLKESGGPLILTINGKPELAVLSIQEFQEMRDQIDKLKVLRLRAELMRGEDAIKRGDYTVYTDLQQLFEKLENEDDGENDKA